MENHLDRPEVQQALTSGTGANIRQSETTGESYYYYVRSFPEHFVRVAAIYDVNVRDVLHVERVFFAYLFVLFILFSVVLMIITRRISETITKLKDFAILLRSGKEPPESLDFPDDDLGEISTQITSIFGELVEAKQEVQAERERLFMHLDSLNEGIAFFSPLKKSILTNEQFIQNLNMVTGQSAVTAEDVFDLPVMAPVVEFVDKALEEMSGEVPDPLPTFTTVMERSKRYFSVRCMFFADSSFEILIINTTRLEKRKRITQELTSNIAHELKTPVTSILGYLETLKEEDVPDKTRERFLKGALRQTQRLSNLIEDIAAITKIEEVPDSYAMEPVKLRKIVDEVYQHLKLKLDAQNINVEISIPKSLEINGNVSMLFSVFYNLFDNVLKYGGEDIEIWLDNYLEDRKYFYFSFANSGANVDDVHLSRMFERFYRIDRGRSREEGGTGLGLSIVKNAIELHGGSITAKSRPEGGLEMLFSLSK
jgi:signal transduction histidine kinase